MKSDDLSCRGIPPFFIIGNPRSGTTLLRLMLTCNTNIHIPPEGGFIIKLHEKYKSYTGSETERTEFIDDISKVSKMEYWEIQRESLKKFIEDFSPRDYSELCDSVYRWHALEKSKNSIKVWGDKNNFYLSHLETLKKIFPSGKYIHIVRDGRDVACSYRGLRNVNKKYAPNLPTSIHRASKHWKNNIKKIVAGFQSLELGNKIEISYEGLVLEPVETLSKICKFLGVNFEKKMLNFHDLNKENKLEPKEFDAWKGKNKKELSESRISVWQKEMFDEDIFHFQRIAGTELKKYNYPLKKIRLKDKFKFYINAFRK